MERLTFDVSLNLLEKQSFGIDKCNNLYLCYSEASRLFFRSKSRYSSWSPPERISFLDQSGYRYAMAVDPATGVVHLAMLRCGSGLEELYYGNNAEGTWEFSRIDSADYGSYSKRYPAIAIDSSSNVHILWMTTYYDTVLSDYFSQIVYTTNASEDWVKQVVFFSGGRFTGIVPWIEVERDGVAHVMWGVGNVYHHSNDSLGGTTWSADTLGWFPILYWWFTEFRVDGNGNLHMLVEGYNYWDGPRYLYYYFRPAGDIYWGDPELVSDMGCVGRIVFDSDGQVHLVWTEGSSNFCGGAMYYSHRDQQGWTSYEIVGENFNYEYHIDETWTSFVIDSDHLGHLVFAACEGLPVVYDSLEVFYFAPQVLYSAGDIVLLINYLYCGAPAPECPEHYDLNCDEILSMADIVILVNYLFRGESLPGC
jgi:hypothetical protein